jgi:spore coat polysaccharide biosynthesis predicted glycosyltransferase SpsG
LTEKESINIKNNVKKVLLSFGGSDPCDYTTKIAKLMINNHNLLDQIEEIIVHLGPSNRQLENIYRLMEKSDIKINIKHKVRDLHSIMIQTDLALSSGGNTMYELCYLGIPTIIFPQNSHQEVFAKELSDHQIVSLISRKNCNNEKYILKLLIKLIINKSLRKRMNQSSIKIFDPNGVRRVGEAIFCL